MSQCLAVPGVSPTGLSPASEEAGAWCRRSGRRALALVPRGARPAARRHVHLHLSGTYSAAAPLDVLLRSSTTGSVLQAVEGAPAGGRGVPQGRPRMPQFHPPPSSTLRVAPPLTRPGASVIVGGRAGARLARIQVTCQLRAPGRELQAARLVVRARWGPCEKSLCVKRAADQLSQELLRAPPASREGGGGRGGGGRPRLGDPPRSHARR